MPERPSNELKSEFTNTDMVNTVRTYIYQINTKHTHILDIRASLGLSSNWEVGAFSAAFHGARRPT
jgi:hypothetical protein